MFTRVKNFGGRPPKYRINSGFFGETKKFGFFWGGLEQKKSGVAPKAQVKNSGVAPKAQGQKVLNSEILPTSEVLGVV